MVVAHRSPRPDLSARPLLLVDRPAASPSTGAPERAVPAGVPGVVVLDLTAAGSEQATAIGALTGVGAAGGHAVGARVTRADVAVAAADAGASLLVLEPGIVVTEGVAAATASGVVLVAPAATVAALLAAGAVPDLVVTERVLGPGPVRLDPPPHGGPTGVVLAPPADAVGDRRVGWETGALTAALLHGVRTVRGVGPARFGRVLAVVDSLARAGEPVP